MNNAEAMIGKTYQFTRELRIGNCKMRVGDKAIILDYGCGSVSYTVTFKNLRLPHYKFSCGDWVMRQYAKEDITA